MLTGKSTAFQRFVLSSHFVWIVSVLFGLYIFGWSSRWTFDATLMPNYEPWHFYTSQADSMLNGHFWVPDTALGFECFIINERCVGYFGIFPSILRMPLVLIFGGFIPEFNSIFISLAAVLVLWSSLDLCLRILHKQHSDSPRLNAWFIIMVAIVLGPGSNLMFAFDPYMYQEAIMWSLAGFLLAVNFFWRWTHERRPWQITGMILACAASAGSRPTTVMTGLLLTIGVLVLLRKNRSELLRNSFKLVLLALLPFFAVFGVLTLKMGSPSLDFSKYRSMPVLQHVADKNGGSLAYSPRYIPTTVLSYFRPDSLNIGSEWPWIRFLYGPQDNRQLAGPWYTELKPATYLPPLQDDSMWLERHTSITSTMPLALFATIATVVNVLRRRQWSTGLILFAALAAPVVIFLQFAIAARYLADMYPILALGTVFSTSFILQFAKWRTRSKVTAMTSIAMLTIFSILTVTMLGTQYAWISQFGGTG
jgi:hypothetical protein